MPPINPCVPSEIGNKRGRVPHTNFFSRQSAGCSALRKGRERKWGNHCERNEVKQSFFADFPMESLSQNAHLWSGLAPDLPWRLPVNSAHGTYTLGRAPHCGYRRKNVTCFRDRPHMVCGLTFVMFPPSVVLIVPSFP